MAASSGLSRRAADTAIAAGRVSLNGQAAVLGQDVTATDDVRLDGEALQPPTRQVYLLLHKPAGYVSSHARQGPDPTMYELLPPEYQRLRLAGRLDRDSSGLTLLSNDGAFLQRHSHPSAGQNKVYELTLSRPLKPADRNHLSEGVTLEDGPSHVSIHALDGRHLTVSITTGRNRQLRRTFGKLGYDIERLHRIQIGPYNLGQLAPGTWQEITPQ